MRIVSGADLGPQYQQTALASTRADRLSPGYRLAHPLRQRGLLEPAPRRRRGGRR